MMPFSRVKSRFRKKSPLDGAAPVKQKIYHQQSKDVQEGRQKSAAPKSPDDLWAEAEKRLRQDEKMNQVMDEAVGILEEYGLRLVPDSTASRQQLSDFLDVRVDELEQKKWTVRVGDHSIRVQEQLTKIFKNVLLFKDMITSAAAASPAAGIVCASMAVSIQLFIQAVEQHDQLLDGLERTSALIPRLLVTERLYLHSNTILEDEFNNKFRERIILLYSKVLEFQARALVYFRKRRPSQIFRNVLKQDPWATLLDDMKGLEGEAQNFKALIDKAELNETNERIHRELQTALDSFQAWQTKSTRDEKVKRLFNVLYTCPYRDRKDRNAKHVPGTCGWFTEHPLFQAWIESDQQSLLWVSADPGCGKSVLARYLVDKVLPTTGDRTICYFFFKDDFDDQKSSACAISSVLRQLFLAKPHLLPDSILDRLDTDGERLAQSFGDLWGIFVTVATSPSAGEVVCVFDALDECRDDDRHQFIEAVTELYQDGLVKCRLKFLITSRPYGDIRSAFQELEDQMPRIHLSGEGEPEVEKISREIDLAIISRVHDISKKKCLDTDERKYLQEQLTGVQNRTYLWISLTLDFIEGIPGFTKGNVRRAVHDEIPHTVDEAYNKILNRSPDHAQARRLLHIITAAKRPLSLQELSLCMALKREGQTKQDIMDETEPVSRFRTTVRDLCGLLLTIRGDKIYLLHQTVKEFLVHDERLSCQMMSQNTWKHALVPTESNKVLAEICVWYLLAKVHRAGLGTLYDYAARHWPSHFREAPFRSQHSMSVLGVHLCTKGTDVHQSWSRIWRTQDLPPSAAPLTVAAALGLEAVVRLLLETEPSQADSKDFYLQSPLSWASGNGHEAVARLLIETGDVEVDSRDSYGGTPFFYASQRGHESVAKLLIQTGRVEVDSMSFYRETPLSSASEMGHEAIVKLLLDTGGVNVDNRDDFGKTPLSLAIKNGDEAVVRLLLAANANPNLESRDHKTPLMLASILGHIPIVRLLLETGKVEIDQRDDTGQTALSWAARNGHDDVVRLLLSTGKAEADSKDLNDVTPLLWAAAGGYEAVVKLLLDTGEVDVSAKDLKYGWTPLLLAAQCGRVEVNSRNRHGGESPVVKLLLDTGRADVGHESLDAYSRFVRLSWPPGDEYEAVAKMLLDTGRADVDTRDCLGRSPLVLAARYGRASVVKLLLSTGQVEIDAQDSEGRTPLSWAAEYGRQEAVRVLLETGTVQVDAEDFSGRSPLTYAVADGHESIAQMLREASRSSS